MDRYKLQELLPQKVDSLLTSRGGGIMEEEDMFCYS